MISNNIRIPACDGLESVLCRYVVESVNGCSRVGISVSGPVAVFIHNSIMDSIVNKTKEVEN